MADEPRDTVGLSYIDVLFALAAGRCFMSAFDDSPHLSAQAWSHFVVALGVITFSWVGYHLNRRYEHPRTPDFRAPFLPLLQLAVDIGLLAMYYVLAAKILSDSSIRSETWLLGTIFLAYLAWDILDLGTAKNVDRPGVGKRAGIDTAFACVLWLIWVFWRKVTPMTDAVVLVDYVFVGLLFAYRVAQAYASPVRRDRQC
jgi:hypothetical protein